MPLVYTHGKTYAVEIPKFISNYPHDAEWVTKLSLVDYEAEVAFGNIPAFCPKGITGHKPLNIDPFFMVIPAKSEGKYLLSNGLMNTLYDPRRQSMEEQTAKFPFGRG